MDIFLMILFYVIAIALFLLMPIGMVQMIGAISRSFTIKDWNSDFGIRLKTYLKLLSAYWTLAGLAWLITNFVTDIDSIGFLFVPVLCTPLAIYYWNAVHLLNKERKTNNETIDFDSNNIKQHN